MNHKDCEMGVILGYPDGPHLTACPLGRQALSQVWSEREVSVERVRAMRQDTDLAGCCFADRGRGVSQAKLERTPVYSQ